MKIAHKLRIEKSLKKINFQGQILSDLLRSNAAAIKL